MTSVYRVTTFTLLSVLCVVNITLFTTTRQLRADAAQLQADRAQLQKDGEELDRCSMQLQADSVKINELTRRAK